MTDDYNLDPAEIAIGADIVNRGLDPTLRPPHETAHRGVVAERLRLGGQLGELQRQRATTERAIALAEVATDRWATGDGAHGVTAEPIARLLRDFHRGRAEVIPGAGEAQWREAAQMIPTISTVVDVSDIGRTLADNQHRIKSWDDHLAAPPFDATAICWVNAYGNVRCVPVTWGDPTGYTQWQPGDGDDLDGERPTHSIDWTEIKWVAIASLWSGGYSEQAPGVWRQPVGPLWAWKLAVRADGTIADLRWVNTDPDGVALFADAAGIGGNSETRRRITSAALAVWLASVDYLNCRNVVAYDPPRARAERRRLERTLPLTRIRQIGVTPIGKTSRRRGDVRPLIDPDLPLHPVRGHFAHYGPEYDRGLLFGKYAGRFFHPQHVRGSADVGVVEHTYRTETDRGRVTS